MKIVRELGEIQSSIKSLHEKADKTNGNILRHEDAISDLKANQRGLMAKVTTFATIIGSVVTIALGRLFGN